MAKPYPLEQAPASAPLFERLEWLKQYYLDILSKDPRGRTTFDRDVLHAIDTLQVKYRA